MKSWMVTNFAPKSINDRRRMNLVHYDSFFFTVPYKQSAPTVDHRILKLARTNLL